MSALTPKNGKYRRSWLTWGKQVIPSEQYKENYDKIKWGELSKKLVKEELSGSNHYVIKFES